MERTTYARPHNNKEFLVASIKEVMTNMDPEVVARACSRLRSSFEAVVASWGNFIDQAVSLYISLFLYQISRKYFEN